MLERERFQSLTLGTYWNSTPRLCRGSHSSLWKSFCGVFLAALLVNTQCKLVSALSAAVAKNYYVRPPGTNLEKPEQRKRLRCSLVEHVSYSTCTLVSRWRGVTSHRSTEIGMLWTLRQYRCVYAEGQGKDTAGPIVHSKLQVGMRGELSAPHRATPN